MTSEDSAVPGDPLLAGPASAPVLPPPSTRLRRWWPWLLIAGLVGVAALMWWLSAIFAPLGLGLLLAFVLEPAVDRLEPWLGRRSRAATLLIGSFFAGLILLAVIAMPMLLQEGRHWAAAASGEGNAEIAAGLDVLVAYGDYAEPDAETWTAVALAAQAEAQKAPAAVVRVLRKASPAEGRGETTLAEALGDRDADGFLDPGYAKRWKKLSRDRNSLVGSWLQRLDKTGALRAAERQVSELLAKDRLQKLLGGSALSTAGDVGLRLLGSLREAMALVTALALATLLIPVYALFFLLALPRWRQQLPVYLPAATRDRWLHVLGRISSSIAAFVRGRMVVCAIVGALTAVGWAVMGVRLGLLMGLAVGALTVVPLANVLAFAPVALMGLLDVASDLHGWGWYVGLISVYAAGQLAESVLNPIIVGDAVQLDMVTIIVSFLIGGAVAGLIGLVVAVPVAATVKILLEELVLPRWRSWAAASGQSGAT